MTLLRVLAATAVGDGAGEADLPATTHPKPGLGFPHPEPLHPGRLVSVVELPFAPVLPLRTERLVLRRFEPDDLDALLTFHGDPEAVRYVPFPPRDRAAVATVLERKTTSTGFAAEGDLIELAVVLDSDGSLIGDVLLALRSVEHETVEVGYIFSPGHGGQGYATEAVRALLDLAFDCLGARRVTARVDDRNVRSRALLERLGFRLEAHLVENEWFKGELTSEVDYGLLGREWRVAPAVTDGAA
jgi:RimJ/RimL family protein N-acetyltransferase